MTEEALNKCQSLLPLFDQWWVEHSHELPETQRQLIQEFWDKYEPYMDADEDEDNPSDGYIMEFNFWFYVWIAYAITISPIVEKAMLSDNDISHSDFYLFISIFRDSREAFGLCNGGMLKMFAIEYENISLEKLLEDLDVSEEQISNNPLTLDDFFDSLVDIDEGAVITVINHLDISEDKKKTLTVSVREKDRESFCAIISQESLIQRPALILSLWRNIPYMTNGLELLLEVFNSESPEIENFNIDDIKERILPENLIKPEDIPKEYEDFESIDINDPFGKWTQEKADLVLIMIQRIMPTLLWMHSALGEYSTNDEVRHAIDEYIHSIPKLESLYNLILNDEVDITDYEGERIDQLDMYRNKFLNI